jgi:hypothetical protein
MSFGTQEDNLTWPSNVPLAGPWNGIRPRPAMTLRCDAMLWAKYGAFCATSSRVVISFPLPPLNNVGENLKF